MSDFIAEARVVIRPDTTKFRAELEASLAQATRTPVVIPISAQVSSAGAVGRGASAAIKEQSAALDVLGASQTKATVTTDRLASAQHAADLAARRLALAQESVAGAASAVGAAQITLSRSAAAVAAAETAVERAVRVGNSELITSTRSTLALAEAQEALALSALTAARAEASQAARLGAVNKAALASGAAMAGLRGQVLTAGTAFLAATVAFQAISKSIGTASDTTEELNKSFEVFGSSSQQIKDFADTTASSLGIANVEALRAASTFGNLFRAINITAPVAADMSEALVRLAADLASFNNADPTEVLANIRSGLAGEAEPLRKFGIFLTEARVQQEALNATGKENIKQLTQAEKVQARFNIILQDSAIAQGDFARTSGDLANQQRILRAELTNLGGDIGGLLIPFLTEAATGAGNVARSLSDIADIAKRVARPVADFGGETQKSSGFLADFRVNLARLLSPGAQFAATTGTIADLLDKLAGNAGGAANKVTDLAHSFPAAGRAAHDAAQGISELKDVLAQLSGLEVKQLEIQTGLTPGGRGAEESNLQAQIEADKRAVEAAASGTKARRQALEELASDQRALDLLQQKDIEDAKDRQDAIKQQELSRKQAAEDATRASQEADQVLLDSLEQRREDAQRRVTAAGETSGLQDDIRTQNNLQALIQQQIRKIRERVKDEQARKEAIRELRIALIESRREEETLRQEQKQQAQEQATQILDIKIEIAETKGQVALERRLLNEKIRRLKAQIKAAKGNRLLIAQLRLELAQTQKQLEDLNKQQQETNKQGKTLAQSQFEFLQTQQGFAANLLGNLIPGFATAGLVGNTSGGGPSPAEGLRGDPKDRVNQAAAVRGAQDRGVRPVQVDTTNHLLRQILNALQGRTPPPPEAAHNWRVAGANMDMLGGV